MDGSTLVDIFAVIVGVVILAGASLWVGFQLGADELKAWKAHAQNEANLRYEAEQYAETCESHAGWEAMRARGLRARLEREGLADPDDLGY